MVQAKRLSDKYFFANRKAKFDNSALVSVKTKELNLIPLHALVFPGLAAKMALTKNKPQQGW